MTNLTDKTIFKTMSRSMIAAAVIGAVSLPVAAGKYRGGSNYNNSAVDYAKVINVQPVILGGVIGNQVGKRGGGKARDVATVAGAVLGGSIGRDTKHRNSRRYSDRYERDYDNGHNNRYNNGYENTRYENVKRCEVRDSYITKEEVVGYDVEYKYRGNVFHTQMAQHPGDKIKVKVTVNPV